MSKTIEKPATEAGDLDHLVMWWAVEVWVRGNYAGAYYHRTKADAEKDATERRKNYSALGCYYIVRKRERHNVGGEQCGLKKR